MVASPQRPQKPRLRRLSESGAGAAGPARPPGCARLLEVRPSGSQWRERAGLDILLLDVLRSPGGPCRKRLWPPAAATSSARTGATCPRTSARSTGSAPVVGEPSDGDAG